MKKNRIVGFVLAFFAFTALVPTLNAQTNVLSQNFNATTFPPAGWSQNVANAWRLANYASGYSRTNYTGGSGYCADRDDDIYNIYPTYPPGAYLQTPAMNCSSYTTVWLAFNLSYNNIGTDRARVEVSNNGSTWTMVREWSADVNPYGSNYRDSVNISSVAAGQAAVYVRFTYYETSSTWAWWYQVDNVNVWGTSIVRQPDSWVKNSADPNPAGYIGNNIYEYPTPSGAQTKGQTVNPGATAIYHIRLTNDGTATDSFRITGPSAPANWTYTYYDALTGGTNITAAVTGAGWNTGPIATTAMREIRVEVTPSVSVPGGTTQNVDIVSTSINDGTKHDVVRGSTTTTSANQPDNQIKNSSESAYIGDNIYNLDGTSQTKSQFTDILSPAIYHIRIQNDGNLADNFTVTGTAGNANFTVTYYNALTGGTNITTQVTGSGWATGSLAVGATRDIRVEVTPAASAAPANTYDVLVTSTSVAAPTKKDAVKASTTVINHRPDNQIKNISDATYIGDNIYNLDGTNQTKSQTVDAASTAVYHIRLENDGNIAEAYTVTGTASGATAHATWTVTYYDALAGGSDITSSVTGAGWSSGSLAVGATRDIRVEVTPNAAAWGFESYPVLVTSTASGYGSVKDAVRAVTTVRDYYQPDNLIKRADESTYVGDGIYNADGTNQTKSYITNYWTTKTFHIRIENDSNTVDVYNVTGISTGNNWTVKYFDALSGGSDITTQVTGTGWSTGSMNPDDYREIRLEVTGSPTADTLFEALITSTSTLSTSNSKELDAVKAVVISAGAQPDGMIKNSSDTLYVGNDVYNNTGVNQTKEQILTDAGPAVYHLKIQNDYEDPENNPDVIEVKGDNGNDSWTVKYYDALTGGTDITMQVIGTGWITSPLKTREYEQLRLEVTPVDTTVDSATYIVMVRCVSVNDGNRKDAVKAVTTYIKKPGAVEEQAMPANFALNVNGGKVSFTLPKATHVDLRVYDPTGRLVTVLASGSLNAGIYNATWSSSTGVYFVKMVTPEFSVVRKVTVIH